MSGSRKTRLQVEKLEAIGEEEIFTTYLELRGIKPTLEHYGISTVGAFYDWLRQDPKREEAWEAPMRFKGQLAADAVDDIAEGVTESSAVKDRVRLDAKKWVAERFNSRFSKNTTIDVKVGPAEEWLAALLAADEPEQIEEAEWTDATPTLPTTANEHTEDTDKA